MVAARDIEIVESSNEGDMTRESYVVDNWNLEGSKRLGFYSMVIQDTHLISERETLFH